MLHNLEMPTQIYHMAALGLSEFWKTAPQLAIACEHKYATVEYK